jgi:hypothetical protein
MLKRELLRIGTGEAFGVRLSSAAFPTAHHPRTNANLGNRTSHERARKGDSPQRSILLLRGQRVMLDRDLAALYGVTTGNLNKAVKRNLDRFPADFMFRITLEEAHGSRFQLGSLKRGQNFKYLPYAFTEQGVAMLSTVLKSRRAVQVNIAIMRAFVRLRETLSLHKELASKLADLERKIEGHDESIRTLFEAIRQLMTPPPAERKQMGFHAKEGGVPYRTKDEHGRRVLHTGIH